MWVISLLGLIFTFTLDCRSTTVMRAVVTVSRISRKINRC